MSKRQKQAWATRTSVLAVLLTLVLAGTGCQASTDASQESQTSAQETSAEDVANTIDEEASSPEATDSTDEQAADVPVEDGNEADGKDGETPAAATDPVVVEDPVVQMGEYTFTIPQYWLGRVALAVREADGETIATICLPSNADAALASLSLQEGEESMIGGDIAFHLAGSVAGTGNRVEVWSTNWPWLVAAGDTQGLTEDELSELVDLSTGGAQSLSDVDGEDPNEVGMQEYDFISQTLVPTIAFG